MSTTITNEMLYDLLKDFKTDINRRFDESDKKFYDLKGEMNQRFEEVGKRMDRLEHNQERLENRQEKTDEMVRDIWKSRDKVQAIVTWDFIWRAGIVNTFF